MFWRRMRLMLFGDDIWRDRRHRQMRRPSSACPSGGRSSRREQKLFVVWLQPAPFVSLSDSTASPRLIFFWSSKSRLIALYPPEMTSCPSFNPSTISTYASSPIPLLTGTILTRSLSAKNTTSIAFVVSPIFFPSPLFRGDGPDDAEDFDCVPLADLVCLPSGFLGNRVV